MNYMKEGGKDGYGKKGESGTERKSKADELFPGNEVE